MNKFFPDAVKKFKIPKFSQLNPAANDISHPILKVILKYETDSSTVAIRNINNNSIIKFVKVTVGRN